MYLREYGRDGMPLLRAFYWGYMMSSFLTTGNFVIDHMDEVECLLGFSTVHRYFPFVSNKCLGANTFEKMPEFCFSFTFFAAPGWLPGPISLTPSLLNSSLLPDTVRCSRSILHFFSAPALKSATSTRSPGSFD